METNELGFTGLFLEEHEAIRRALRVLSAMTEQVERKLATDHHDVNALLIFLHYFGDVLHQGKEESVLFPGLEHSNEFTLSGDTKTPLAEHKEGRGLIERTQLSLLTDRPDEFIMNARKLIHLLSEHIEREEQLLFPLAERILTMANEDRIVVKLQEADARFGFRQRKLLMDMLQQLEDKYIGKA